MIIRIIGSVIAPMNFENVVRAGVWICWIRVAVVVSSAMLLYSLWII